MPEFTRGREKTNGTKQINERGDRLSQSKDSPVVDPSVGFKN